MLVVGHERHLYIYVSLLFFVITSSQRSDQFCSTPSMFSRPVKRLPALAKACIAFETFARSKVQDMPRTRQA